MEHLPFEDVFPIENEDFPVSHVSFLRENWLLQVLRNVHFRQFEAWCSLEFFPPPRLEWRTKLPKELPKLFLLANRQHP